MKYIRAKSRNRKSNKKMIRNQNCGAKSIIILLIMMACTAIDTMGDGIPVQVLFDFFNCALIERSFTII